MSFITVRSCVKRASIVTAPKIAGIDSKKEYLTSCSLSIPTNIPAAMVVPLLDMLENIEIPWPIPISTASIEPRFLWPIFSREIIKISTPVTMKPMAIENGRKTNIQKKSGKPGLLSQ